MCLMKSRPTLHNPQDLSEIIRRIHLVTPDSKAKWGRMTSTQMLMHCAYILEVPIRKRQLKEPWKIIKMVGIATKYELRVFTNGLPNNMPTFSEVIADEDYDFDYARSHLLQTIVEFTEMHQKNKLPSSHVLFGKMTPRDWGFMEYLHLHHHLNQFQV